MNEYWAAEQLGETRKLKILRDLNGQDVYDDDILLSIRPKNIPKSTLFTQEYNSKKDYDKKRLDLQKKIK